MLVIYLTFQTRFAYSDRLINVILPVLGDLIPFDSIPSISKFGPITRSAKPMERIVSPLSFAAMQHQGMHQGSSPVLNAAAAAAVAAQLSLSQQESAAEDNAIGVQQRGPRGAIGAGGGGLGGGGGGANTVGGAGRGAVAVSGIPNNGTSAMNQEMSEIDEEIHQLDRRINRVYEEEALKQKLADVEAEIKRFELGNQLENRRSPLVGVEGNHPEVVDTSATSKTEFRNDQERLAASGLMGAVGGINVDNLNGVAGGRDLPVGANVLAAAAAANDVVDDEPAVNPSDRRQPPLHHHQQQPTVPDIANHELSFARQMMFDQQMLAVARQMMELQQGATVGFDPVSQFQSLNLYQAFRGGNSGDVDHSTNAVAAPIRPASLGSLYASLPDVACGAGGGATAAAVGADRVNEAVGANNNGGRVEGNLEQFSASEQRQWQRLQRQFDKPEDVVAQESENADFTLPFAPDGN